MNNTTQAFLVDAKQVVLAGNNSSRQEAVRREWERAEKLIQLLAPAPIREYVRLEHKRISPGDKLTARIVGLFTDCIEVKFNVSAVSDYADGRLVGKRWVIDLSCGDPITVRRIEDVFTTYDFTVACGKAQVWQDEMSA